jgi:hypothetical protein
VFREGIWFAALVLWSKWQNSHQGRGSKLTANAIGIDLKKINISKNTVRTATGKFTRILVEHVQIGHFFFGRPGSCRVVT